MADGIRIQPQAGCFKDISSYANALIVLRDWSRPFVPDPSQVCHTCGVPHECKTYHFQLDSEGTIMVSTTIWNRLLMMFDHGGFETVNVVRKPPAQGIILPAATVSVTAKEF